MILDRRVQLERVVKEAGPLKVLDLLHPFGNRGLRNAGGAELESRSTLAIRSLSSGLTSLNPPSSPFFSRGAAFALT